MSSVSGLYLRCDLTAQARVISAENQLRADVLKKQAEAALTLVESTESVSTPQGQFMKPSRSSALAHLPVNKPL